MAASKARIGCASLENNPELVSLKHGHHVKKICDTPRDEDDATVRPPERGEAVVSLLVSIGQRVGENYVCAIITPETHTWVKSVRRSW